MPHEQPHEFEELLFTDPAAFERPELINDSPETAPSKRIMRLIPEGAYSKTEHGRLIAESIGIEANRAKHPAFSEWVGKLQAWGGAF